MTKISINQKECIGCSFCSGCAPEIFEVDQNDFKCKIKKDGGLTPFAELKLSEDQQKQVRESAEGCPVQVIKLS